MSKLIWAAVAATALATAPAAAPAQRAPSAAATAAANAKLSGRYHSTPDGTFWSNGQLPQGFSLMIEIKFEPNKLVYHSVNDTDKAKPMGLDYTATLDGTTLPLPGQTRYNQVSVKQLGPNEFQLLKSNNGDVIVAEFWTFRPDGKTLVRRGVGKDAQGVNKAFQETFVRM